MLIWFRLIIFYSRLWQLSYSVHWTINYWQNVYFMKIAKNVMRCVCRQVGNVMLNYRQFYGENFVAQSVFKSICIHLITSWVFEINISFVYLCSFLLLLFLKFLISIFVLVVQQPSNKNEKRQKKRKERVSTVKWIYIN